ncbi:LysR family transcriptional regulator [Pseudidiomarina sediminum]|uniref:LysR family transcriptional regulator n=1 Tax=Pseudidiomarina sediminum TaxID=431675 RepID=UPI001C95A403|nr:LysR family transcriptional regulator [Pseudidiomarina sediminum]MBY6062737.1 LysR family transcriptional regulator [Pseudidiomarina sediminum]
MLDHVTTLRVFHAAAARGSLSAAARHLGMSPAMASKHMNALEARLGAKLLERSTRRLSLTELGETYLQSSQQILRELDDLEADIQARQQHVQGRLNVNAPLSFGTQFITPLIAPLSQRYPLLDVALNLSDAQHDLSQRNWDVTIRVGVLGDSGLRARKLADCPVVLCASPAYWQQHGKPQSLTELAEHNCLSYTLSDAQNQGMWRFGRDGEHRVPVTGSFSANNGDALRIAAEQHLGIIYQPLFIVADALKRGTLATITLNVPNLQLGGIHALFHADQRQPAKVRAFIDYLTKHFAETRLDTAFS